MVAAVFFAYAGAARADESDAERLFREGRALMLEGRFEEACPKIAESQRVEPRVGTLLNLAVCHERRGRLAVAWDEYQKVLAQARSEHQVDRARLAEQRIAMLEPRLSWLRVSVPESTRDVSVSVDGTELEPAAVGMSLPVDPGVHAIVATTKGKGRVFEERVDLREGDRRVVSVEVGEPAVAPPSTRERVTLDAFLPPVHRPHWVFEPGVFLGYVRGSLDSFRGGVAVDNDVRLADRNGNIERCGSAGRCFLSGSTESSTGAGFNGFAGYAFTERVSLGARVLAGGHVSGNLWAAGPAARIRVASRLELGLWGVVGDMWFANIVTYVRPLSDEYVVQDTTPRVRSQWVGSHGVALGGGLEVSVPIATIGPGRLVANLTPFVLSGNGGVGGAVPLGLAYRFD